MSSHHNRFGLSALLAASLLAGCAASTVPDYRPRLPGGTVGYSDLQLSPNLYRISFSGSTASTRDDVERYLLRRAAEVTLASGYTHFVLSGRDTERDTSFYGNSYLYGPYPYYYPYYQPYPYYPYYGAPYYAPYPQYPTEWIERPDYAWYYCASLQAYYPYVTECPDGGWQRVEPHPPGAPQ